MKRKTDGGACVAAPKQHPELYDSGKQPGGGERPWEGGTTMKRNLILIALIAVFSVLLLATVDAAPKRIRAKSCINTDRQPNCTRVCIPVQKKLNQQINKANCTGTKQLLRKRDGSCRQ